MPQSTSRRSVIIQSALVVVAVFFVYADWPGRWDDVGLWEPAEIAVADEARALVTAAPAAPATATSVPLDTPVPLTAATAPKKKVTRLSPALIAFGFETWGVSERSGRRITRILAALALLSCYFGVLVLLGSRPALIATLIAAGTPLLFVQARSLLGDMPFTLGVSASFISFCVFLEARKAVARAVAAVAFVAVLYLVWRARSYSGLAIPLMAGLAGVAAHWRIEAARIKRLHERPVLWMGLGLVAVTSWVAYGTWVRLGALLGDDPGVRTAALAALGASPGSVPAKITYGWVFEQIGIGCAPWTAFLPVIVVFAVSALGDLSPAPKGDAAKWEGLVLGDGTPDPDRAARLALHGILWVVAVAMVLGTIGRLVVIPYAPVSIPFAVATAATLHAVLAGRRIPGVFALLCGLFGVVLARDMAGYPDAAIRLLVPFGAPKLPEDAALGIDLVLGFLAIGVLWALVMTTLVLTRPAAERSLHWRDRASEWRKRSEASDALGGGRLDKLAAWVPPKRFFPRPVSRALQFLLFRGVVNALRALRWVGRRIRPAVAIGGMVAGRVRLNAAWLLPVLAFVFGAFAALRFVPVVSAHFSQKGVFDTYHRLAVEGEEIAELGVRGGGAIYYLGDKLRKLPTQNDFFAYMGGADRKFALVTAAAFPGLQVTARKSSMELYVLDDSNANQLLLSNILREGEVDRNVITRYVSRAAPAAGSYIPVNADFEGKLTLLGYTLDNNPVARGGEFTIALHLKVEAPLGRAYKIFYHVDGTGGRIKGDHVPVLGKFPTNHWQPGDYVTDVHTFKVGRTQASGTYTAWMGFYYDGRNDDSRLKIRSAGSARDDGHNRLGIATVTVR